MKIASLLKCITLTLLFFVSKNAVSQQPVNWTAKQLMQPSELATTIQNGKNIPVLISVGPGALIPGSIAIGAVQDEENLAGLKTRLKGVNKQKEVVVYCGCCPFEHCPNVRPAIDLLKKMNFTNYKLLNLPDNIKTDWMDKGYPTSKL